jgi:putative flippase GtrA
MSLLTRHFSIQFLKFLGVGVANTLIGLGVIYAAKYFLEMRDVPANLVGYSIGLMISFALNSRWTFAYEGPRVPALGKFILVTALAYSANLLIVLIAIDYFELNGYLGQALGMPVYTVASYLASKHVVFSKPPHGKRGGIE